MLTDGIEEVRHDRERARFVLTLEGGEALLEYSEATPGVWDLYRTYVPAEHRRRGLASRLVRAALDAAEAEGRRIVPSCWFVADFLVANPRYRSLVVTAT